MAYLGIVLAVTLSLLYALTFSQQYALSPMSAYITGCVPPCKCPLVTSDLAGSFSLSKGKVNGVFHLNDVKLSSQKAAKSWSGSGWVYQKPNGITTKLSLKDEKGIQASYNGTDNRMKLPAINARVSGMKGCNVATFIVVASQK